MYNSFETSGFEISKKNDKGVLGRPWTKRMVLSAILFHSTFGVGGMLPPILFLGWWGSHNPRIEFGRNQTLAFILDLRLVETIR